jgi:hypothetical protein
MNKDITILEEAIRLVGEGRKVIFPVNGASMLPFIIGGRERVELENPAELRVGDVVLAWVDGCRYVVHRIIVVAGNRLVLQGDGNTHGVERCSMDDVKAKVTHVVDMQGRRRWLYTPWRRFAARLWYYLKPIRRYLLAIYRLIC